MYLWPTSLFCTIENPEECRMPAAKRGTNAMEQEGNPHQKGETKSAVLFLSHAYTGVSVDNMAVGAGRRSSYKSSGL